MARYLAISDGDDGSVMDSLDHLPPAPTGQWYLSVPGPGPIISDQPRTILMPLIVLNKQGARDLSCPRGKVIVEFRRAGRTETPVAEGCGKRAVYLPGNYLPGKKLPPFDLASVVPVNEPCAPSGGPPVPSRTRPSPPASSPASPRPGRSPPRRRP
jgi:hypothetical protein